ncbi:MAG: cation/H(+) antiporter [Verrucomicrobiaceae bacterium]|nr:MAG: cation/H(+) antiporter [Verrucomicrobiaceae bacterium]
MKRASILYLIIITLVVIPIVALLHYGASLPAPKAMTHPPPPAAAVSAAVAAAPPASAVQAMFSGIKEHFESPLSHLFLQLVVIITASRIAGKIFTLCGQPSVVGEMAAGILLGPSLFGWLAPDLFHTVFPVSSFNTLKLLSQVGVCLFMFSVGMELNVAHVREKAHTAVVVSHASIVFPYLLGVILAWFLYTDLAAPGTAFLPFALFMGISMSITAFPVLARILQDRGMSRSFLGSTAITCAAVDDVTAWCILAFVVAIAGAASLAGSAMNLVLVAVFIALMLLVVKPGLPKWLGARQLRDENPSKDTLAIVICVVVASGLFTEVIGIHALFGAFLAGAIMPDVAGFRHKLAVRIENFSSVLLLPLFFAFTGLRTQVGLLNDWQGWLLCLGIIGVATVGKLGGSAVTARLTGMSWSDSLQLGALMNTRGLMELIALNIGYDLGILPPRIFTMLVIMALATTMLTGPLLTLFGSRRTVSERLPEPLAS